jgi:undecaprenyl pyrophosphate phosphatase UppP
LGFTGEKAKVFEIVIQTGAMCAVIWEYRTRSTAAASGLLSDSNAQRFLLQLAIAFVPAAIAGLLFGDSIKQHLFNPTTVAVALIVGGIVMMWAERRQHSASVNEVDTITWRHALKIGLAQCLVSSHTFDGFAAYRIVFGLLILVGVRQNQLAFLKRYARYRSTTTIMSKAMGYPHRMRNSGM